jgi:hypothetical protein
VVKNEYEGSGTIVGRFIDISMPHSPKNELDIRPASANLVNNVSALDFSKKGGNYNQWQQNKQHQSKTDQPVKAIKELSYISKNPDHGNAKIVK